MSDKTTVSMNIKIGADPKEAIAGLQQIRKAMGDLSVNQEIFAGVDKEFKKINDLFTDLKANEPFRNTPKGGATYNKYLDSIVVSAGKISAQLEEIGKDENNVFQFKNLQGAKKELDKLVAQLNTLRDNLKDMKKEFSTAMQGLGFDKETAKSIKSEEEMIQKLKEEYEQREKNYQAAVRQAQAQAAQKANKVAPSLQTSAIADKGNQRTLGGAATLVSGAATQEITEGIKKGEQFEEVWKRIKAQIDAAGISLVNENGYMTTMENNYNALITESQKQTAEMQKAEQAMQQLGLRAEDGSIKFSEAAQNAINMASSIEKGAKEQETLGTKIEESTKNLNQQYETEKATLLATSQGAAQARQNVENLAAGEKEVTNEMQRQQAAQDQLNASMQKMQTWITNVLSLTNGWRQFRKIVTQTFNDVQKLDKAFASIAMVTDKTVAGLWDTYDSYADMANRLGQSTESAIKASALFYQQGLDTAEALSLTEDTMKLATLAGADFETATQQMTAALRGFHMEMDEGARVTDVYSELAANAAADVNGIAYAMSKTASIASNAGMDFETTAAFITNMIETTQEAPENIGTAMKTIIARFTELKENVSAADSEFDDLDYNKVDTALKSVGISLKDAQGQFRDLDDVFLELSSKWDTLDRNTQRYIATIAAGSRQQSRFIAMMEDYDRTMELVETAQNSAGRSEEQFAKYQDTVEYKINQLKNSWEQLRVTMIDSDIFKGAIDSMTKFVQSIQKIDFKRLIVMAPIVTPLITSFIKSFISGIQKSATNFQTIGKTIGEKISTVFTGTSSKIVEEFWKKQVKGAEQKVNEIDTKIRSLSQRKIQIQVEKEAANQSIEQLTAKVKEAKTAYENYMTSEEEDELKKDELESTYYALNTELVKMKQNLENLTTEEKVNKNATEDLKEEYDKAEQSLEQLNEESENRKKENDEVTSAISSNLQMVASAAVTMFAAIASGADASTALKGFLATMGAQLASLIAQLVSAAIAAKVAGKEIGEGIGNGINEGLLSTGIGAIIVGISMAIAAIGLGISELIKKYKEEHKSLDDQITEAEEKLKEIESTANEKKSTASETEETAKNTENLISRYDELSKKIVKTTEEQEEWNELISKINEEFPEIVTSYDEANNKISIQRDLWQDIADLQKEAAQDAAGESLIANAAAIGEKKRIATLNYQNKQIDISEGRNFLTSSAFYDIDSLKTGLSVAGIDQKTFEENFKINLDSLNTEEFDNLIMQIQDENSAGWLSIQNNIDSINKSAQESYQKQMDYYDALEKEELSSYLQSDGTSKGVADFIAEGAQNYKTKNVGQYDLQTQGLATIFNPAESFMNDVTNDFQQWEKLSSEQKEILKSMGYADKATWEAVRKNLADDKDFAAEYAEAAYQYNAKKLADALDENLDDSTRTLIDEYMTNYQSMSETDIGAIEQKITDAINKIQDKDARDTAMNSLKNYIQQHDNERTELITSLQTKIADSGKDFSDWTIEQLNAYDTLVQNAIDKLGVKAGQDYIGEIDKLFEGYDPSVMNQALNSINWESANGNNWEEFRANAIASLKEIGIVGAEAFFDEWATFEQKYGNLNISLIGEEEVSEYLKNVEDMIDKIKGNRGDIADLSAKIHAGVTLDIDDYDKYAKEIEEMGLAVEDYLTIDDNGNIIANAEKITTLYKDAYDQQIESIQTQIDNLDDELDLQLEQLRVQHEDNLAEIDKNEYIQEQIETENEMLALKYEELAVTAKANGQYSLANDYMKQAFEARAKGEANAAQVEEKQRELREAENERYINARTAALEARKNSEKALKAELVQLKKEEVASLKAYDEDYKESYEKTIDDVTKKTKEVEDATKKVADAQQKVADALDKIAKAEQNVIDKTNELNEALYGSDSDKNKLDPMYNYTTALDRFTKKASEAKEALENMQPGDNAEELLSTYATNMHAAIVNRTAQNERKQASIDFQKNVLETGLAEQIAALNAKHGSSISTNVSDYVYQNGDRLGVNYDALNAAALPKSISDYVEETIQTINKLQDEIDENVKANKKAEQEMRQLRKSALERRKGLEEDIAKMLEEEAQKEVDVQKEKYDALKEADDDYLNALEEAINKQRELRERQNEWDDLATKEKKLSLMQRDTSGANQKEVMQLENEVQDDREKLLDNSIDDIIKGMKEAYELQQETKEMELEYQEKLLESINYMQLAEDLIDSFETAEDYVAWMTEHNTQTIEDATMAEKEILLSNWEDTGNQMVADTEIMNLKIEDLVEATDSEVSQTIIDNSDTLTMQAEQNFQEVVSSADTAITKAETALTDAIKEVQNARDDYISALDALKTAQKDLDTALKENEALQARVTELNNATNVNLMSDSKVAAALFSTMGDSANLLMDGTSDTKIWRENLIRYGKGVYHYASGGLVDYTGPAWVDGTPGKPEAFLSAEDTERIGKAAQLLSNLPIFGNGAFENTSISNGDSLIEVHINIENIASDVDLDNALDKMKNAIWEAANPAGSSVILSK